MGEQRDDADGAEDARFVAIRDDDLRRQFPRLGKTRLLAVSFAFVVLFFSSWIGGYSTTRLVLLGTLLATSVGVHLVSALEVSGCEERAQASVREAFLGLFQNVLHSTLVAVTGGLRSPLVAMLLSLPVSIVTFGRSRASVVMLVFSAVLFVPQVVVTLLVPPPSLSSAAFAAEAANCMVIVLMIMVSDAFGVADANRRAGLALDRARQDVVTEMLAHSRDLQSISAKVAHELKNPLAVVKSLTQLMSEGDHAEAGRRRHNVLRAEIERMETILRDYLTFARPLEDLEPAAVVVEEIVDDVLLTLETRASSRSVVLSREGRGGAVIGDRRRLKEALLNLVANAIEACAAGNRVTVRLGAQPDGGALLTIEDTGRGMTRDQLDRIGTPFVSSREGGTGLGVVLARGVIQQHGGELTYESEEGKGTRARIRLPASPLAERPTPAALSRSS
jgi:signal transduction histidine kinase